MATGAGCGRICVVTLVTVVAGYGRVRAGERPHGTVIERGRHPRILVVAVSASCRELLSDVIGVSRCVIVIGMTTGTGIGRIVVIAVVAGCAVVGNGCVSPDQLIEVIVNGESGWRPSWICGVTGFTGGGQIQRYVAWIGGARRRNLPYASSTWFATLRRRLIRSGQQSTLCHWGGLIVDW